jgi:hypothetical protein
MKTTLPECPECDFKLWPCWCYCAIQGLARYCEVAHRLGRADYRELIAVRTRDPGWAAKIEANPGTSPRPCCGQPDPGAFFGTPEPP